jgi:Tol biopolymer transport system component
LDRAGKRIADLGEPGQFLRLHLSPDRKNLAVSVTDPASRNLDIWIYDVARNLRTPFTTDPAREAEALWSPPDGGSIVFNSQRKGALDLYRKPSNGTGNEEILYADNLDKHPNDWSPDGKFLLYSASQKAGYDLWVLPDPLGKPGTAKPYPFLQSEFSQTVGRFSPDGKWVAYQSNQSKRSEIYVAPFPGPGKKLQISTNGGTQARWSRNGREIFYLAPGGTLVAAEIKLSAGTLEVGKIQSLFSGLNLGGDAVQYDVSADGKRFLVIRKIEQRTSGPLTVIQNWTALLKK